MSKTIRLYKKVYIPPLASSNIDHEDDSLALAANYQHWGGLSLSHESDTL